MPMFGNLKNLAGLMGQAKEMREKFEARQAELARKTVEAVSGAGAVTVTMNGNFEVVNVRIDPSMVGTLAGDGQDADRAMVEDLIAAAFNAARTKAQEMVAEEMRELTGGLDLPGMDQLMGG